MTIADIKEHKRDIEFLDTTVGIKRRAVKNQQELLQAFIDVLSKNLLKKLEKKLQKKSSQQKENIR
ncbi:MAG: hypothetical protein GX254_06970 [Clostridiales bacterium]|jgi:hypothetical protein|nr:hypothetical protein [Clostridiales bacterium]